MCCACALRVRPGVGKIFTWSLGEVPCRFQKRVSVKRSYGRVTGVGHTSLSSASIRSGEIIIPTKCGTKGYPSPILGSARVHCAHLAREESAHRDSPGVGIDDLSALHTLAQRQGWASRPVSDGRQKVSARHWNTHGDCTHMAGGWTAWGERGVWRWWCGGDVGDGGCGWVWVGGGVCYYNATNAG